MTTPETPPNGDRPTSWRDVYTLIQDVEKRLTDRLDEAVTSMRQTTSDHEHRIRAIENVGGPVAQSAQMTATANAIRITALEAANVVRNARFDGRASVFSYGQKVIMVLIVVVNAVIAAITLMRP